MRTRAARLYQAGDIRVEEFNLPDIREDEILAKVVSDSLCMSTYKAAVQGSAHKRVPESIGEHPVIMGHEFSGVVVKSGSRWRERYPEGMKFTVQPNINYLGKGYAPGYSFEYFGGNAEYIIIPREVMEGGFFLEYRGDAFYCASLAEPMSCIIAAFHESFRPKAGTHTMEMGTVPGGAMALLAGAGPMGLGAVDYALHMENPPSLLVVTDIDSRRLERAAEVLSPSHAEELGVKLVYVHVPSANHPVEYLRSLSSGRGFDDVFVFAPVEEVVEMGDRLLAQNGCLNFFAGPVDPGFSGKVNFFNVHYAGTRITGTSGGLTSDMQEALDLSGRGVINPSVMITHVGGLSCAAEATLQLPKIPGGKKLIYTHADMELTALDDLDDAASSDPRYRDLADAVKRNSGLWSAEAEEILLSQFARRDQ